MSLGPLTPLRMRVAVSEIREGRRDKQDWRPRTTPGQDEERNVVGRSVAGQLHRVRATWQAFWHRQLTIWFPGGVGQVVAVEMDRGVLLRGVGEVMLMGLPGVPRSGAHRGVHG